MKKKEAAAVAATSLESDLFQIRILSCSGMEMDGISAFLHSDIWPAFNADARWEINATPVHIPTVVCPEFCFSFREADNY